MIRAWAVDWNPNELFIKVVSMNHITTLGRISYIINHNAGGLGSGTELTK